MSKLNKYYILLFIGTLYITFLLNSCEPENKKNEKLPNDQSIFENIEFTGIDTQKQTFKLKAKKASLIKNAEIKLQDIFLFLIRDGAIVYSIFSKKGTYLKSENLIILSDSKASTSSGKIKIKSYQLQFNEKTKVIQAKKISIDYSNNLIKGELMNVNENLNLINLQKVTAKLNY